MGKTFNLEMNIVKAIGIALIVAGHTRWSLFGDFFTCYSFHVALFFFISGYFCNFNFEVIDQKVRYIFQYLKKIFIKYWSRYYAYHIFYAGIFLLVLKLFNRKYGIMPTWENIFLTPIYTSPFQFDAPNWFLYQLAVSLAVFILIMLIVRKFTKNNYLALFVFVPLAIISILLTPENLQPAHTWNKVAIKILISIFYIYIGYLYRNNLENKIKFNIKTLSIVFLVQVFLIGIFKNIGIDIHRGIMPHNIVPLIAPFTGIYFTIFIAKLIAPLTKEDSFIHKIGKNTLHIMANHLFVFFLIELIIFVILNKPFDELPRGLIGRTYDVARFKFIYTFSAIIICTYIGIFLNHTGNLIQTTLKKYLKN